ncbi:MAG TPA: nitrilase-related carbon-nitrogen hydrolase, partial [Candidatus Limnocylindrales bacterium]|nr:nitrilase-related carbon-nitrogen hydrolase [Candidatus Limnocylindrales bacterium]
DTSLISGGSCIVDPFGQVLAGPARDGETVLVADLDLDQIVRGKFDLDITGHYARPDIFRLLVNTNEQVPVALWGGPPQDHEHDDEHGHDHGHDHGQDG